MLNQEHTLDIKFKGGLTPFEEERKLYLACLVILLKSVYTIL